MRMATPICSIGGCGKPACARGWCRMHYGRWRRNGDPHVVTRLHGRPLDERLWARVDKGASDGCWLWGGFTDRDGYGQIGACDGSGRLPMVHRVAYELLIGPIPEGLELDHLCGVRHCVNPKHLEPVTHAENVRRSAANNRLKTHCPQGHPYDEANTYVCPKGYRSCRTCRSNRKKASREAA